MKESEEQPQVGELLLVGARHPGEEGALAVVPAPGKDADVALLHGREFLTFEKRESPSPSVQQFAIGNGSAGAASSPEALKHSLGKIPDNAGPPGSDTVWQPSPVLRTPKSAMTASQGLNDRAAARTQVMRAGCFLLPALRPGMVVEIQELPGELGGSNWLLTRVIHRLDPRSGGRTQLQGVLAGARGESLLGALLGAIGGLL
ncbi:MAG: hypothetical protein HGA84_04950 [Syntrophobacteraceae bacterium]|nr:hypothetical protein [Syntrophobacteraceae bacterium]